MDLASRFEHVAQVLAPNEPLWKEEVIEQYPHCFDLYPEEWLDQLESLSREQLFLFERQQCFSLLPQGSLREYCERLSGAAQFERSCPAASCELGHLALQRINGKKRHEIQRVLEQLDWIRSRHEINHVLDFAGGMGNLARTIAKYYGIRTTSLDFDEALQRTGHKRYLAYLPQKAAALEFCTADILALNDPADLPKAELSLGLHTCGALANKQLSLSAAAAIPQILNFSCCYYKMEEEDYYLSQFGRQHGLRLGSVARTLASHSPRTDPAAYTQWKRVKRFRYLIHLFLYHELGRRDFVALGNSPAELYRGSFSEYAGEQLRRIGLNVDAGLRRDLEAFARCPQHSRRVWRMILANSIRSVNARALEALLLIDRALYLEERGYQVQLKEMFDRNVSPRNVGILAQQQ